MTLEPSRGQIWRVNFDPVRGHEQAGRRPALIVSDDQFNYGPAGLVILLPLTRTDRRVYSHLAIDPPEGGVQSRSYIMCEQVRAVSKERLIDAPWGSISTATMAKVSDILAILLHI